MRRLVIAAALMCALAPTLTFAQSADVMAQIQALLAQISAVKAQINAQSTTTAAVTTSGVTTSATSTASVGTCPALTRSLTRGVSGADVLSLQNFLVTAGYLSADSSTGFFGALTEAAVQKFQVSNNIVSSGSAATTGYGSVGSRTRAMLQQHCTPAATVQNCPFAPLPNATVCAGTWSAITDSNGCTHAWQCTVPLPGPAATISCSTITLVCSAGMHPQTTTGCSQACFSDTTTASSSCPVYSPPLCSSNQHLVGGLYNTTSGCYAAPQCAAN